MGRKKKELKQLRELPLEVISLRPGASDKTYGPERVREMAQSLNGRGMRDPIVVKKSAGKERHIVLMGGCRLLAAKKLGWRTIPSVLLDSSLSAEIKLLEALRDKELTPWELADTLNQLKIRLDWTQAHLGQAIGKTRDFVANMLTISQITRETREFILAQQNGGELTARHLRYVARAPQHKQMGVAQRMLERDISTTTLEKEQHGAAPRSREFHLSNLRALRTTDGAAAPDTLREWKKYQRQLTTDIRRLDRREALEQQRIQSTMANARMRKRLVKQEAQHMRRELQRELRRARKLLEG